MKYLGGSFNVSMGGSAKYRDGWEKVFGKKKPPPIGCFCCCHDEDKNTHHPQETIDKGMGCCNRANELRY